MGLRWEGRTHWLQSTFTRTFSVPACARFARETFPDLVTRYVEPGEARVVSETIAVLGPDSVPAAEAALSAVSTSRCVLRGLGVERGPSNSPPQGAIDGPRPPYSTVRPDGRGDYRLVLPRRRCLPPPQPSCRPALRVPQAPLGLRGLDPRLAPAGTLRGVESCRSFLRDAERFFSRLFPGVVGYAPSSFHRRLRKLRRFLEPLRRAVLSEFWPETLRR